MRKCQFSDTLIVAMYVWSVAHDRPKCWAADRSNYHRPFCPRRLPSRSQFERRLAKPRAQALLQAVWQKLAECDEVPAVLLMDARPLPVGPYSQDVDAAWGKVAGGFARGYKLHAITNDAGFTVFWRVTPLNVAETQVAEELIREAHPQGLLLADGNYDSGKLYDLAAGEGALLFTPLPENVGSGHRPQSHARLLAARLWAQGGDMIYRCRTKIERQFSQQTCFGGGLGPLPPWVRGLQRVTQWTGTKLMIYHVRLRNRRAAA
jgi:hypothetical protein